MTTFKKVQFIPWLPEFELGNGYDILKQDQAASALCEGYEELIEKVKWTADLPAKLTIDYEYITTIEELEDFFSAEVAANANVYGVSVGAEASIAKKVSVKKNTVSIIVKINKVWPQPERLKGEKLNVDTLLDPTFTESYGDYYIHGHTYSATAYFIYTIEHENKDSALEGALSLSLESKFSGAGGSIKVEAKTSTTDSKQKVKSHIVCDGVGDLKSLDLNDPAVNISAFLSSLSPLYAQAELKHYSMLNPKVPMPEIDLHLVDDIRELNIKLTTLKATLINLLQLSISKAEKDQLKLCVKELSNTQRELNNNISLILRRVILIEIYNDKLSAQLDLISPIRTRLMTMHEDELQSIVEQKMQQDIQKQQEDKQKAELAQKKKELEKIIALNESLPTHKDAWKTVGKGPDNCKIIYGAEAIRLAKAAGIAVDVLVENKKAGSSFSSYAQDSFEFRLKDVFSEYVLLGFELTSNWNDGTGGSWKNSGDEKIIGRNTKAKVSISSLFSRGFDWSITWYYVPSYECKKLN